MLLAPSGRAARKSSTAAARVSTVTLTNTRRSRPKSPPSRLSRIRVMDRGYRNMSTGREKLIMVVRPRLEMARGNRLKIQVQAL